MFLKFKLFGLLRCYDTAKGNRKEKKNQVFRGSLLSSYTRILLCWSSKLFEGAYENLFKVENWIENYVLANEIPKKRCR